MSPGCAKSHTFLVLLVASGLMTRSVLSLLDVDPGVRTDNVLTLRVPLPGSGHPRPADRLAFFDALLPRVAALAGVERAAATSSLPMAGPFSSLGLSIEGAPLPAPGREPMPVRHVVTPGYFETMGIRLLAGRLFDARDGRPGTPAVALVNETFARRGWPDADPAGHRVKFGDPGDDLPWLTVVGVVSDVRQFGLGEVVDDDIFLPYRQLPLAAMTLVVRGSTDVGSLARRSAPRSVPSIPISCSSRRGPWPTSSPDRSGSPACSRGCSACPGPRRSSWRRSACTRCWRTPWSSARARSACAWPSARIAGRCGGWWSAAGCDWRRPAWRSASRRRCPPRARCRHCCSASVPPIRSRSPAWPSCCWQRPGWRACCPPTARPASTR